MFDIKVTQSVLSQLEEERGITRDQIIEAMGDALAAAYKKEYGKRDQIIRANINIDTGETEFTQVKIVVDDTRVYFEDEAPAVADKTPEDAEEDTRVRFNPEKHLLLEDARKIKSDAQVDDELTFPLENKDDFGRIAAQTAKQVIMQKIREAEKGYLSEQYGKREGEILSGTVQRIERGSIFVDLGRATGIIPYEEQIPGEHYRQGERIRSFLYKVEETPRGIFLYLSRSHPAFLEKLFASEAPEIGGGTVEIKAIAREAGSRSKVAVASADEHIDPVGSLVGQRGVRVSTVMSELGGEKIDVIEWSADPTIFIEEALSPAKILSVEIVDEEHMIAIVTVSEDQQSLAIGKGGQNVRLAAKLTGWKIDIRSVGSDTTSADDADETEEAEKQEETVDEEEKTETPEEHTDTTDTQDEDTETENPTKDE